MADLFLDVKPMKLPKNGSDVICFKTQTDIIKRNCHSYVLLLFECINVTSETGTGYEI